MDLRAVLSILACVCCLSCASAKVDEQPSIVGTQTTPEAENTKQLEVEQMVEQSIVPTGRAAYVAFRRGTEVLGAERSAKLLADVRATLIKKGYALVDDRAKGHLDVSIYPFEHTLDPKSRGGVTFTGYVHAYGKRPRRWFSLSLSIQDSLNARWDVVADRAHEAFAALEITAPASNQKMAGDPGCAPRFGYEYGALEPGELGHARINRVLPKSPAARAGVKVGDYLVAVDSLPPGAFETTEDQIYERRVTVPLKLIRDDQIVRTTIRADLLCTY